MRQLEVARPELCTAGGRAGQGTRNKPPASGHSSTSPAGREVVVLWRKRGKDCIIGKLVLARPLGCLVYGTPYRHRQEVEHVSIPPMVLAYAQRRGATLWIARFDLRGECWRLPLSEVEKVGWLATSEGQPEWFVPLSHFQALPWQEWSYVRETVTLGEDDAQGRQLPLPLAGAGP